MGTYGITEKGFILKRMDAILDEVHNDLTEGLGIDTRLSATSVINVITTSFCGQMAKVWEVAQNNYYSKYPATANGINLDNSVQYGGIRRAESKRTIYPLHCTGDDGTYIRKEAIVTTDTTPKVKLFSASEFQITRESFNSVEIVIAAKQIGVYSVSINGSQYSYFSQNGEENDILNGLKDVIQNTEYDIEVENSILKITDTIQSRNNVLSLSDNLTTSSVTTIANFLTEDYGKITLPHGIVTKIANNISGFTGVINLLEPTYGRKKETDIELRQSYIAKSALRSNTMIDSIVAELLNNVANVESASGYENDDDVIDERGLPPHSIEIVVEGGNDMEIAQAILRRKAGGIQTYGSTVVKVPGNYGDAIPIRFNRPDYLYAWLKIVLHGDETKLPTNYTQLTKQSLLEDGEQMIAGTNLLTQLFHTGIYAMVAGITYIDVYTAYSDDSSYVPVEEDYQLKNIIATTRQKILMDENRIEVIFHADI